MMQMCVCRWFLYGTSKLKRINLQGYRSDGLVRSPDCYDCSSAQQLRNSLACATRSDQESKWTSGLVNSVL